MASSNRSSFSTSSPSPSPKAANEAPWFELVAQKVATLQYGVVQIVIHDSRVVQVESTERFRFEPPRAV